jgi:hypothetical protein
LDQHDYDFSSPPMVDETTGVLSLTK